MAIFYSSVVWTNLWALAIEVNVQESGDKAGQSLWSFIVSVGCCRHAYFMHISSVMEAWEGLIMLRCFADTSLGYIRDPCCNFIAECYLHNQKVSLKSFIFICHTMHECIWQQEKTKTKQLSQCFFLKVKLECVFPRQIQWAVVQEYETATHISTKKDMDQYMKILSCLFISF